MKKRKVLVLEREKYRQLAYYTLRTTLHLLLMFYEDEVKAMDLIEKASDSLHYSPWKHLPFSLFFKLVGFEPPLLTLVVPKMLVASLSKMTRSMAFSCSTSKISISPSDEALLALSVK